MGWKRNVLVTKSVLFFQTFFQISGFCEIGPQTVIEMIPFRGLFFFFTVSLMEMLEPHPDITFKEVTSQKSLETTALILNNVLYFIHFHVFF